LSSEEANGKSMFDRLRKAGKYQDISTNLRPFGYEFFQETSVQVFSGRKDIPVPMNYVVGPGDEVRIMLWGRVNSQYNLIVDRDGRITIPQIGPVSVAGMTFEQMSRQIIGMTEQMVGANIDIAMGTLKTTPIFVLGDVRGPAPSPWVLCDDNRCPPSFRGTQRYRIHAECAAQAERPPGGNLRSLQSSPERGQIQGSYSSGG
jgi:hypothetical protein